MVGKDAGLVESGGQVGDLLSVFDRRADVFVAAGLDAGYVDDTIMGGVVDPSVLAVDAGRVVERSRVGSTRDSFRRVAAGRRSRAPMMDRSHWRRCERPPPRGAEHEAPPDPMRPAAVVRAVLAVSRAGDFQALLDLLDPHAEACSDAAPQSSPPEALTRERPDRGRRSVH